MSGTAVLRIVERNLTVYSKLWRGMVFSQFIGPLLFLGAMGVGLGGLVDDNVGTVDGLTYLQFVAPALMVATGVQLAAGESLWPVMAGWKWMGFYHGMIATPLRSADVYGGFVIWTTIRVVLSATVFLIVAAALGGVPSLWGVLAVPAAGLCAAAFCSLLGAFSIGQDTDAAFSAIMRLGIVPLMLFSGTFFPVEQLPSWLEPAVWLSPLWHGVELTRAATSGRFDAPAILVHVAVLVGLIALGFRWGTAAFARRLTP